MYESSVSVWIILSYLVTLFVQLSTNREIRHDVIIANVIMRQSFMILCIIMYIEVYIRISSIKQLRVNGIQSNKIIISIERKSGRIVTLWGDLISGCSKTRPRGKLRCEYLLINIAFYRLFGSNCLYNCDERKTGWCVTDWKLCDILRAKMLILRHGTYLFPVRVRFRLIDMRNLPTRKYLIHRLQNCTLPSITRMIWIPSHYTLFVRFEIWRVRLCRRDIQDTQISILGDNNSHWRQTVLSLRGWHSFSRFIALIYYTWAMKLKLNILYIYCFFISLFIPLSLHIYTFITIFVFVYLQMKAAYRALDAFCELPDGTRAKYERVSPDNHGYVKPGTEK